MPRDHHTLANHFRGKIIERRQRWNQRHVHLIRQPSPSTRRIQHFNRIGGKPVRMFLLKCGSQSINESRREFCRTFFRASEIRWRRSFSHRRFAFLKNRIETPANPRIPQIAHPLPVRRPCRYRPRKPHFVPLTRRMQISRRLRQLQRRRQRRPNRSAPARPHTRGQRQQQSSPLNFHAQKQQSTSSLGTTHAARVGRALLSDNACSPNWPGRAIGADVAIPRRPFTEYISTNPDP